jgi:hypothetical protein
MAETKTNEQIFELIMEVWHNIAGHLTELTEDVLVLKAEMEKTQEGQRGLMKAIREVQAQVYQAQPRQPQRSRQLDPDGGDLVGRFDD